MFTIAINGAAGRMGKRLVALAAEDGDLRIGAALEATGQAVIGQDAGLVAGAAAVNSKITDHLVSGPRR